MLSTQGPKVVGGGDLLYKSNIKGTARKIN